MATQRRTPGSQTSLREANRSRIIDAVKRHGGLTQVELAEVTGLSPATVSNIVKELSTMGVVLTRPSTRSGRRARYVTLAHSVGLVAGIHFSTRHLRVLVTDAAHQVLEEQHMPLAREHRADNELNRATLLLADMLATLDSSITELLGVGVAVSAPLLLAKGTVARHGILRGWTGVNITDSLQRRINRPVFLDNASNLAALAEARLGAGRGKQNFVYLDIGDGIGSGLVLGGTVYRGRNGTAGEFGHTVIRDDGPLCRCGNRGCLEAIAGGPALLEDLEPSYGAMRLNDIVIHAVEGHDLCIRALGDAGDHIGLAAGNLCNTLDPERVVVGGELARAGEILLGPLRHAMERAVIVEGAAIPDVVQGQLGWRAAAMGAALRAIDLTRIPA